MQVVLAIPQHELGSMRAAAAVYRRARVSGKLASVAPRIGQL